MDRVIHPQVEVKGAEATLPPPPRKHNPSTPTELKQRYPFMKQTANGLSWRRPRANLVPRDKKISEERK